MIVYLNKWQTFCLNNDFKLGAIWMRENVLKFAKNFMARNPTPIVMRYKKSFHAFKLNGSAGDFENGLIKQYNDKLSTLITFYQFSLECNITQWHRTVGFVYRYFCVYFRFIHWMSATAVAVALCVQQNTQASPSVLHLRRLCLNGWPYRMCMNYIYIFIPMSSYWTK